MDVIAWQSLATAGGLGLLLSAVVLPILKEMGVAGRGVLVSALIAGQVFAQAAVLKTVGPSWSGAADALLLGLVAAAAATGLYEWKEAARAGS